MMRHMALRGGSYLVVTLCVAGLSGCGGAADGMLPGDADSRTAYEGIAPDDQVYFSGTEPFWGGKAKGTNLTYSTPEDLDGQKITASRFAGRNGLSYSGELREGSFTLAITPGDCSDGMSDRTYPFVATMLIGEEQREGCAWTRSMPYAEHAQAEGEQEEG